jgi:hypothetical protein
VRKDVNLAKFWIDPEVKLADSYGFSARELNRIGRIIDNRRSEIEEAGDEYFKS